MDHGIKGGTCGVGGDVGLMGRVFNVGELKGGDKVGLKGQRLARGRGARL